MVMRFKYPTSILFCFYDLMLTNDRTGVIGHAVRGAVPTTSHRHSKALHTVAVDDVQSDKQQAHSNRSQSFQLQQQTQSPQQQSQQQKQHPKHHSSANNQPAPPSQPNYTHLSSEEKLRITAYYKANIQYHAKRGDMAALRDIFKRVKQREIPPSNTLLSRLVAELHAHKDHQGVVEILQFVTRATKPFDRVVYNALIAHFAEVGDQETVRKLQVVMSEKEIAPDLFTYTALMKTSVKDRDLKAFEKVVQTMKASDIKPNIVTYNQQLTLLAALGKRDEFERLRAQMENEGIKSNRETYHIIVKQHARRGTWDEVDKLIRQMQTAGIDPNVRTYNLLFKYAVTRRQWVKCDEFWGKIKEIGPSEVSFNLRLRQAAESSGDKSTQTAEVTQAMEASGFVVNAQVYSTLIRIAHDKGKVTTIISHSSFSFRLFSFSF